MNQGEPPVIQKAYDLAAWLCRRTARFPRPHRFGLGDRIEREMCELLVLLVQARYTRDRQGPLRQANLCLEVLRMLVRLSHDLQCLRLTGYEYASRELHQLGAMVGGWVRGAAK